MLKFTYLVPECLKNLKVVSQVAEFEEIDVMKALAAPARLLYPKVAKKTKLDDLLARRLQLKSLEEKKIAQSKIAEDKLVEDEDVDIENDDVDLEDAGLEKQLNNMMTGKVSASTNINHSAANREVVATIAKKIQTLRLHYGAISKLAKDLQCYSKGCTSGSNSNTSINSCYSPMCIQRIKVRKELLALLRRANLHTSASGSLKINLVAQPKKTSILEQKLTEPQQNSKEHQNEASICKDLATAVLTAQESKFDDANLAFIPKKIVDMKVEAATIKVEVEGDATNHISNNIANDMVPHRKKRNNQSESENEDVDMDIMSPDDIKKMILGPRQYSDVKPTISTISNIDHNMQTDTINKCVNFNKTSVIANINGTGRTIQTMNAKSSTYGAQQNRRFCTYRAVIKREEKAVKMERAEDGTQRIYSATSSEGKVYLKRVINVSNDKHKKRQIIKYPVCSTFLTKKGVRSILILPKHEVRKLSRSAGRIYISGFHALAKPNNSVWPYPCARPLFKTCWMYRTVNLRSLAAAGLQLRILWACLRWDDMQAKPLSTDGKHQVTTETEILSLELLKHKCVGQFLERTQYLRRKVVIPLELPKTVRGNIKILFGQLLIM